MCMLKEKAIIKHTKMKVIWTWSLVIIPTCLAVAGLTFADYFYALFNPDCLAPYELRILIALTAICNCFLINSILTSY